jgi:hypothetical protein
MSEKRIEMLTKKLQ